MLARLQVRERNRVRVGRVRTPMTGRISSGGSGVQEIPSIRHVQGRKRFACLGDVERTLSEQTDRPQRPELMGSSFPLAKPERQRGLDQAARRPFANVARLVTAGVGSQLAFGFEAIDDLQLAIELAIPVGFLTVYGYVHRGAR